MVASYERPFRPVESVGAMVSGFPLRSMAEQLRSERTYAEHGVDALTLVRSTDLTVVLTVVREGHVLGPHRMPTTAMLLVLEGAVGLRSDGGASAVRLEAGAAVSVGVSVEHEVQAQQDALLLTVLGAQPDLEDETGRDPRWTVRSFEEATREASSLLEELGLPDYRFEVEPAEHGWRVRVERMVANCWRSRDLFVSSQTLSEARRKLEVRQAVLAAWRYRLQI